MFILIIQKSEKKCNVILLKENAILIKIKLSTFFSPQYVIYYEHLVRSLTNLVRVIPAPLTRYSTSLVGCVYDEHLVSFFHELKDKEAWK